MFSDDSDPKNASAEELQLLRRHVPAMPIRYDLGYANLDVEKILFGKTPLKYERDINAVFIMTEDVVRFFNAALRQDQRGEAVAVQASAFNVQPSAFNFSLWLASSRSASCSRSPCTSAG